MKKGKLGIFLILVVMVSCRNGLNTGNKEVDLLLKENPVTINWHAKETGEIESFSADVSVYEMNSRKGDEVKLQSKYRMSQKKIGNKLCNRVDISNLDSGADNYSALYNGEETIIFEPQTDNVLYRIKETNDTLKEIDFLQTENALTRINLTEIRERANRLAFDVTEEKEASKMLISIPSKYFDSTNSTRLSTKVKFDTKNEVLEGVETVEILPDGTKITCSSYPLYEEKNGEPIRIGSVTTVETDVPILLDIPVTEYFEKPEDVPQISKSEYERLKKEGAIEEIENMTFGDPRDLDSTRTIIELYNDIEINNVSENMFRLLQ